jgi:hypothetical protein
MIKDSHWLILGICLLGLSWNLQAQEKIEIKKIDGITHIINPANPFKGTIKLEVEPILTINPYDQPEIGLKTIRFSRDDTGNLILFSGNQVEAHRFSAKGNYLGPLGKQGQGPGEFIQAFKAYFFGKHIYAFSPTKVAQFDLDGKYLRERRLDNYPILALDEGHYLAGNQTQQGNDLTSTLQLVLFDILKPGNEKSVDLLKGVNIGYLKMPGSQIRFAGDRWGAANFFYAGDLNKKRIYVGLNTAYRIIVKDFMGRTLFIIEKPHENVRISKKDVEFIFRSQFEKYGFSAKDGNFKWIQDVYPDHLAAIKDVFPLPNGFIAVYRIVKPMVYEIDIFNQDGRYVYALIPPSGIRMDNIQFHGIGFSVIETQDDLYVYREYRIKNVPEVFGR